MHELGLAQGILQVALEAAGGEKIRRIELRVGKGQMVKPDSLEFSFKLVAEGTPAAGAGFAMKEIPILLRCNDCGAQSEMDSHLLNCNACGSCDAEILSGNELLVDAVELESGRVIARRDTDGQ